MTIVTHHKTEHSYRLPLALLGTLVICALVLGLFWYNQIVNLTHELETRRADIQKIQVVNADLKQEVFGLTSFENLQRIARAHDLVVEKNPQYLELDSRWLFASHY